MRRRRGGLIGSGTRGGLSSTPRTPGDPPVLVSSPTFSSNRTVGIPTTVSTGSWSNTPLQYDYQWYNNGVAIVGATSSTYTPVVGDVGDTLSAKVTATNQYGFDFVVVVASGVVTAAPAAGQAPTVLTAPVVSDNRTWGVAITVTTGGWSDSPSSYAYQWRYDGVDIPNATSSSFTPPTSNDIGKILSVRVTATNGFGSTPTTVTAGAIVQGQAPGLVTPPTLSANREVGLPIDVVAGTYRTPPTSYTYQWYLSASPFTTSTPVPGATSSRYIPVAADVGKLPSAEVRAYNQYGFTIAAAAPASTSEVIVASSTPPPPPPPDEEKAAGRTATASSYKLPGSPDHLPGKAVDGDTTTRWSSYFDSAAGIPGQNGEWWQVDLGAARLVKRVEVNWHTSYATSYTVATSTNGTTWTTQATVSNSSSGVKVTSFTEVTARYVRITGITRVLQQYGISFWEVEVYGTDDEDPDPPADVPVNTVRPSISGTPKVGSTLFCSVGEWTVNDQPQLNGPWTFQWIRGTANISGATADSYVAVQADANQTVTCRVTMDPTSADAVGVVVQPATTTPPPPNPPQVTSAPTVSGDGLVGHLQSGAIGSWSNSPTGYQAAWQDATTTAGPWADVTTPETLASPAYTVSGYSPPNTRPIRLRVRATNSAGSTDGFSAAKTISNPTTGGVPYSSPQRPFPRSSLWNLPLSEQGVTYTSDSDSRTVLIRARGVATNYANWSVRVYSGTASDPLMRWSGKSWEAVDPAVRTPVNIPNPLNGTDTDGTLCLCDTTTLKLHEGWQARPVKNAQGVTIAWTCSSYENQPLDGTGMEHGMVAADIAYAPSVYRKWELDDPNAEIAHMIGMLLPSEYCRTSSSSVSDTNGFQSPANTKDGYAYSGGTGAPKLGTRFACPDIPSNLTSQSGIAGKVCRQARDHGWILLDTNAPGTGGSTMKFRLEASVTSAQNDAVRAAILQCRPYMRTVATIPA